MAEVKKENAEKKVKIKLQKEQPGEQNFITVSLNGKVTKIMRGVEVEVSEAIAEILEHSNKAYADAVDYINKRINE